jgi:hypothetical protein
MFWYGYGETVEASVDGTTWVAVKKGENLSNIPTGFDPTNKALYIRVTFAAGLTEAYVDSLQVNGYTAASVVVNGRTLTYTNPAVVFDEHLPFQLRDDWGVRLTGGTITITPDAVSEVPSPVQTVEIWMKRTTEDAVVISGNVSGAATTKYFNGIAGNVYDTGEWTVRHFVSAAGITGNITITGNAIIGKVAIYPTALSAAEVAQVVAQYTGVYKTTQDGSSPITIAEPASSTTVYSHDWEILTS